VNILKTVSIITILILIIPVNGMFGNYRYESCTDSDVQGGPSYSTGLPIYLEKYEDYFFICEIGFIEGKIWIGWEVANAQGIEMSISIMNMGNLRNFIEGDTYGYSNANLASLHKTYNSNELNEYRVAGTDATLIGDVYFLVINLGYRDSFESEEVEQRGLMENYDHWISRNSEPIIYCNIDIDYIEDW